MKILQRLPKGVRDAVFEATCFASNVLDIRNPDPSKPDSLLRTAGRMATSVVMLRVLAVLATGVTAACVTAIGAGVKMVSSFTGDAA